MYQISKRFTFSAGHILDGLPEGHQCGRPHGHNYTVEVRLAAPELDATGFILDYGRLAPFKRCLDAEWDHRWLGSGPVTALGRTWQPVLDFNPTAERIAEHMTAWLRAWLDEVVGGQQIAVEVAVSETEKTWAVYEP